MKLWQKIFLYTLILVMLAVSITSILLLKNSFSLALDQRKQNVYSEHEFMITSFKSLMVTERLRANAVVLDEKTLQKFMVGTFGEGKNGIAFFNGENEQIYANKKMQIPGALVDAVKKSGYPHMQVQKYQLYTASAESIEGKNYYVITENDIQDVVQNHENILRQILVINMSCAMGIALILLVVVKMLLHPLKRINEGTREIAQGSYHKRIKEQGHDELSELAHNMNLMAESVEINVRALENVAEDRKHFIDNLSHEMKTPLTSISGFAEIMKNGDTPNEMVIDFSNSIYDEAQRLISLVSDIMKISELDEKTVVYEKETVDLYSLSLEVAERLRAEADKKNIKINVIGDTAEVIGVRKILDEMMYNLCDNAIKYNKENGIVDIIVSLADSKVKLIVRDTGIGIPTAQQSRVFERFYRVDKARSKSIGGTGLGLAIVKHGAIYHNAEIELESKENAGTLVSVIFK